MAPRRKTTAPKPATKPCPDCQGGQTSESFQVGGRRKRVSDDRQQALCLTCLGTGHAPD
ncbi:hypothetical protein PV343_37995 [Streptomyces sp. WI03-4A]|uniref:hypothetical protein n=1 Tax=Streptomyces sp. WI03-4A TaxID=3028706 RepID=UPI0029BF739C|nr:hypothetical protein [Streptomyces sp. WI03-4A]MDX2598004.1 hypothetical protein [Streptomyces sp. WI03-4A]